MFSFLIYLILLFATSVSGYLVSLTGDGDVIPGETTSFKAEVFEENGILSGHEYTFIWSDNANPSNTYTVEGRSPVYWNLTYSLDTPPGLYNVTVKVKRSILLVKTTVGTKSWLFNITKFVSGEVVLRQGNYTRKKFVSNEMPVNHTIVLKDSFVKFLNESKNFLRVFWFVDCIYYGSQSGFEFDFNYTKVDSVHYVEALMVSSYNPKIPKGLEVFTKKKTAELNLTLSQGLLNVTHSGATEIINKVNETSTEATIINEDIDEFLLEWLNNFNATRGKDTSNKNDYCLNSTIIPISPKYTYGIFKTNLTVRAPVKISPINGTNWLMDGEILNINVSCNGSSPYTFCVLLKSGLYNITGNETCKEETVIWNCSFGIQHLFKKPSEYTLVVIISNAVSRVIKPIAVNIYKVKKHAQLSVIIVPVSFSLIATILIIFGVAYYVQSKHKYTIEVADFDFGNQTSNMEYKTFRERLRESISNSFLKSNDFQDDDSSWSDSVPTSRKYGSMQ